MASADQILDAISSGNAKEREQLLADATSDVLIDALRMANGELQREVLCHALGRRHERSAVDPLIALLADGSPGVRSAAADALAKIRDPRAGSPLMNLLEAPDPDLGVLRMVLVAVGAVGYRAAIPTLIEWLKCPDPSQRGGAAWSLGALLAQEAVTPLKEALQRERSEYPKQRILEALFELRKVRSGSSE